MAAVPHTEPRSRGSLFFPKVVKEYFDGRTHESSEVEVGVCQTAGRRCSLG